MTLTRTERDALAGALGYTAEVCPPNGTPATEFVTDRWGRATRDRIVVAVEGILAARLKEASHEHNESGIWGGTTWYERRAIVKRRRRGAA